MRVLSVVIALTLGVFAVPSQGSVSLGHGGRATIATGFTRIASQGLLWGQSAASLGLRGRNGERITFTCEPRSGSAPVWGTDTYTDDSAICEAALHAGVLSEKGGTVVILIAPGVASYTGSSRNGVVSHDYGAWQGSFSFASSGHEWDRNNPANSAATSARAIEWGVSAATLGLRGRNGEQFTFQCNEATGSAPVWGTDHYTDDSAICEAAVHAGVITRRGGVVVIQMEAGRGAYTGSFRHEVDSHDYGPWQSGYFFVVNQ